PGHERVTFAAGITAADLTFARVNTNDLRISIAGAPDTLTVQNWYLGASYQLSAFALADGTIVPLQIAGTAGNDAITGSGGADALSGQSGNDTLDGGPGDDPLIGTAGNDTYVFGLGSGNDLIDNSHADTGIDKVKFGAGIAASDVTFTRVGNNLRVTIANAADTLTVQSWYADAA